MSVGEPGRPKTYSPKSAASAAGVSESTIRRWLDEGLLDSAQPKRGCNIRISAADLDACLRRKRETG
jgi:excisionase family DNA binding protein